MSRRHHRAIRALEAAERSEMAARAQLSAANQAVEGVSQAIRDAQNSGATLADLSLSPGLRARYSEVGANNLKALSTRRHELRAQAIQHFDRWDQTRMRVQSLERLVERIRQSEAEQRRRAAAVEMLDTVGARASIRKDTHGKRY